MAKKEFLKITMKMTDTEVDKFISKITTDWWARHKFVNGRKGSWKQKMVTYLKDETWKDEEMPTVFETVGGTVDTVVPIITPKKIPTNIKESNFKEVVFP